MYSSASQNGNAKANIARRQIILELLLQILKKARLRHVQNVKRRIENLNSIDGQLLDSERSRLKPTNPSVQSLTYLVDAVLGQSDLLNDLLRVIYDLHSDPKHHSIQKHIINH